MTLQELYQEIGGDYELAMHTLRLEKLLDKHIRKITESGTIIDMINAGDDMDPKQMYETAHAVKGVCSNLGLMNIASLAAEITEEFRPGNPRTCSDEEIRAKLQNVKEIYEKIVECVARYKEG